MYKVIVSESVDTMLQNHIGFISKVSPAAAERFLDEFSEVVQQLQTAPKQFPWYDNPILPEHTYRKALFSKWYKVVFSICEGNNTVYVDAAVDGRSQNA